MRGAKEIRRVELAEHLDLGENEEGKGVRLTPRTDLGKIFFFLIGHQKSLDSTSDWKSILI